MKYSCVIVDDEKDAAEGNYLLLQEDDTIKVVGMVYSGSEAIELINKTNPDILLLDIQMPEISGFDVLRNIDKMPPAVIFITAHDEYAVKAFEIRALDYILKPFTDTRFREMMERAKEKIKLQVDRKDNLSELLNDEYRKNTGGKNGIFPEDEKLTVKADGKIHFLDYHHISHIEAYDYYIKIYHNNSRVLVRESLKSLEKQLPEQFIRVHRSWIINKNHIETLEKLPNREFNIFLKDGVIIKSGRNYCRDGIFSV